MRPYLQIEANPPDACRLLISIATSHPPRTAVSAAPAPTAAPSASTSSEGRAQRRNAPATNTTPMAEPTAAQAAKAAAYEKMRRPSITYERVAAVEEMQRRTEEVAVATWWVCVGVWGGMFVGVWGVGA